MIYYDALPISNAHRVRGVGEYTRSLLEELTSIKYKDELEEFRAVGIAEDLKYFNCQFKSLKRRLPRKSRLLWISHILEGHADYSNTGNKDIVQINDPNRPYFKTNSKVITTAYDLIPLRFPHEYLKWTQPDVRFGYNRFLKLLKHSTHIVAISEATKLDLIELLGIEASKISVIYPAFPHKRLLSKSPAISTNTVWQTTRPYFLYVGAHDWRKNLLHLIDSYVSIEKNIEEDLVIVGPGTSRLATLKQLQESRIKSRIHFLGLVSTTDKVNLYKRASALVIPSKYEGFGLPLIEAQSYGCPVITSNGGALPEIASDSAVIFDLKSDHALASALNDFSGKKEIRETLTTLGFQNIKRFLDGNAGELHFKLYRTL